MQIMPYISPETMEETGQVDFLLEMMGDSVSRTEALRVYRKHKGNVERAADAMVNGDRGGDYDWDPSQSAAAYSQISPQPSKPSNTVIDLTGSDDELQRAMAMSLEREPTFGPSNRPPDSNWAMVTTNVNSDMFYHGDRRADAGISNQRIMPSCPTKTSHTMTRSRRVWKTLRQPTTRTWCRSIMSAKVQGWPSAYAALQCLLTLHSAGQSP